MRKYNFEKGFFFLEKIKYKLIEIFVLPSTFNALSIVFDDF
jgi:hypothetical protein